MSPAPLSPSRRAAIEQAFEQALDVDPEQRAAWLSDHCADDAQLRAEVDALLAAHESPASILERRIIPAMQQPETDSLHDRRIGPYRVVRELGRGGMGVVYLAERVDGEFTREVAIKLLRNSPDADELERRFIAERQILASLSHPNIAQMLDGGTTDGQLPYLVMEYVDGVQITTYCDRHALDVAARLRLFLDVCRAVSSAHQNLVIHRDIKPGNILVTAAGQVKLLDFGIAKLLNSPTGSATAPDTRTTVRVMTPEYASPEQVRGDPLTTGSDVYSLGVVLYELLAGRRPYEIRSGAARELHELICEREPERPSTRARRAPSVDDVNAPTPAAIASSRGTSPERLERTLAGDLDAIVMMALRKEPRRRYGAAELLAEDIERYLDGRPVLARRPSRAYYLGKFLRRHRAAVSLGTVAFLSLVAGIAAAVTQTAAARRERDRATSALTQARQALRESDETTNFLAGLFDADVPAPGRAAPGTTQELIARGMVQVEQLKDHPLVQARMLEGMGRIYENAVQIANAKQAYERSLALRRANGAGESAQAANTLIHLANTLRVMGRYAAADSMAWEALHIYQKLNGPSDPSTADAWHMLSMLAVYRSDLGASEAYARRSMEIRIAAYGADDPRNAAAVELVGGALRRLGRYEEGEQYMRRAITLYERDKGSNDVSLVVPLYRLADALATDHENYTEAARLMERGLAIARASLGEGHPRTAYALEFLGALESRRGNFARAERLSRTAVEIFDRALGRHDVAVADAFADLGKVYSRAGRWSEAESAARTAVAVYDSALGRAHPAYAAAIGGLCEIHLHAGRLAEAESECQTMRALRVRALGPNDLGLIKPLMLLGDIGMQRGDVRAADSLYTAALSIIGDHAGSPRAYESLYARLAALRARQDRPAEAAEFRRRAHGTGVGALDF